MALYCYSILCKHNIFIYFQLYFNMIKANSHMLTILKVPPEIFFIYSVSLWS